MQAWGDRVLGSLRPKAKALYQAGHFVGSEGGHAVFALPNEIHRQRCEEVRPDVEAALAAHFGRPVPLRLEVDRGLAWAEPGGAPDASREAGTPPSAPRSPSGSAHGTDGTNGTDGRGGTGSTRGTGIGGTGSAHGTDDPDDPDDLSAFDESELGAVVDVDNSVEARLLQAFPGAEEVE